MPQWQNYVAAWREYRGLTQQQLADRIGTSNQQISRLELGQRGLKANWLSRLAATLDCTVDDLLNRPPERRVPSDRPDLRDEATRTKQLILEALRDLHQGQEEQTRVLRELLEAQR